MTAENVGEAVALLQAVVAAEPKHKLRQEIAMLNDAFLEAGEATDPENPANAGAEPGYGDDL